jgi:hypothetical protein
MKTLALLFYKNKAARPPVGPGECLHKIKSHPGGFAPKGPFFFMPYECLALLVFFFLSSGMY